MEDPLSASSQDEVIPGGSGSIRQSPPSHKEQLGKEIILVHSQPLFREYSWVWSPKPPLFSRAHYFCGHWPGNRLELNLRDKFLQSTSYVRGKMGHQLGPFTLSRIGQVPLSPLVSRPGVPTTSPPRGETGKYFVSLSHVRVWLLWTNKITKERRIKSQAFGMGIKLGHKLVYCWRWHLT